MTFSVIYSAILCSFPALEASGILQTNFDKATISIPEHSTDIEKERHSPSVF